MARVKLLKGKQKGEIVKMPQPAAEVSVAAGTAEWAEDQPGKKKSTASKKKPAAKGGK